MKIKSGFTLAEVLITLGIIGVIAALTMPTIIQSTNRAKIGPELVNTVNTLENGLRQFMTDYNSDYITTAMTKAGAADSKLNTLIDTYLIQDKIDGKYIKGSTVAYTDAPKESIAWNGGEGGLKPSGTVASKLLPSQTLVQMENASCAYDVPSKSCGILVYISGYQKKQADNKLVTGRDVFKLNITNNGQIYPEGLLPGGTSWESTCGNTITTGVGCAGRIANNGWKADF